jgi:cytochrome oxidase assembly protein ShyY1
MMYGFLRSPRWIAGLIVVATVVAVFLALGNWQLTRHREVSLDNEIFSTRLEAEPIELDVMFAAAGTSIDSLEYRRAVVTGTFEPAGEVLVRNQVNNGTAGFHVVTPFRYDGGTILVNRGWVPLELDTPPIEAALPPSEPVEVELLVRASQPIPAFGRVEPEGELDVVNRIDLERLDSQFAELAPAWGQLIGTNDEARLPVTLETPRFDDDGPHLAYAAQWFLFATIAVVGSGFLIRSTAKKTVRRRNQT